jgi:hypothetical protein
MNDLTLYVNAHSSASDCWPMFVGQLEKHWRESPRVVVASDFWPKNIGQLDFVDYSPAKKFSNQYLMGLCAVDTPYALTLQEDFLMYDDVDEAAIARVTRDMWSNSYVCERLIDSGRDLLYSMQATIWNTRDLMRLYANVAASDPWDAEVKSNAAMEMLSMRCRQRRDAHLPLRGRDHRDSPIFPYIATALVKGKWNSEYRVELELLHREYGIDANIRGWSA